MGRFFVVKFFKKVASAIKVRGFYLLNAALCATFFYQINDKNTKPARFS